MGSRVEKSKPLIIRSSCSVSGDSYSQRNPRLTVRLFRTRQSLCAYKAITPLCSVYSAARLIEPPLGTPSRKDARSWPRGAPDELSSGPRVYVLPNVIVGETAVGKRLECSTY